MKMIKITKLKKIIIHSGHNHQKNNRIKLYCKNSKVGYKPKINLSISLLSQSEGRILILWAKLNINKYIVPKIIRMIKIVNNMKIMNR